MQTLKRKALMVAARKFMALSLALSFVLPAAAQTPVPPAQNASVQDPVARPVPERTVGLEPGKVVRWTLRDAIMAALEKNVDIELEKENVRLAQYDLIATRGVYDPITTSTINYNARTSPNTFRFSGSAEDSVQNNTLTYNFGVSKAFERYGSGIEANFNNSRVTSNVNNFSPQYTPNLTVNLTQPLMKDFRIDANRRSIKIAKRQLDLSDAVFRQQVINIIARVQAAYWDLALAIQNENVNRDSVKLAETQLNNTKRQVEVGTLAPIDVISTATQLESRRQQVFQAINSVAQAENALKALTVSGPGDELWNTQIVPVETFDVKPVALPLADAVKLAQENRPELKQLVLQKDINKINVDFFANQAKPQVNLVASYSSIGIGGTPNSGIPPSAIFPQFIGGYGTSLKNLFKQSYPTWSVGMQFSLPLRNTAARANLGKAKEQERQLDLQTRRQLQNIEVEVRNSVQTVETTKMRIEAARAAREYAEKQLEGEEKKFAAGLSQTFFVLQRQNELAQTRFSELQALADYNKAVAELQRVISTTLSSNNIEIKAEAPVTIK